MRHDLYFLLFLRLQYTVTNDSHFGILFLLVFRLQSEFLEAEDGREILMGSRCRFRFLVHYFQRGVPLREFVGFSMIQTQPGVVVGDPNRKLTFVVMVVD